MKIDWQGRTDYVSAMQLQDKIVDRCSLISSIVPGATEDSTLSETILGFEHPLTITLGRRANPLEDIKVSVRVLRDKAVAIHSVERGGQATLHNPGQLVIYPIINLRIRKMRVRDYIHLLEDVTKRFLADHGITACCRGDEPGLYTINGKIAFFGVRIQGGMTSHGLALNVDNNLEDFSFIRSCGNSTESFSKMSDFNVPKSLQEIFHIWCTYFQTALGLTQDMNRPMLEKQLPRV